MVRYCTVTEFGRRDAALLLSSIYFQTPPNLGAQPGFRGENDEGTTMFKHTAKLTVIGLTVLLAACGGNGGGDDSSWAVETGKWAKGVTPVINAVSEGAWTGTTTKGDALDLLLLENGSFYTLFRADIPAQAPDLAFAHGNYLFTGDQFAASGTQYSSKVPSNGSFDGNLNRVTPGATLSGNAINSAGNPTATYVVNPVSAIDTNYDYNRRASLADIAGAWSKAYVMGDMTPYFFTIDANTGELATSNLACNINARFTRHGSNKNVFDVSLKFGPSSCKQAGASYSGVALSYLAANGKQQLTAALLEDTNKANATMLFAQR